jgi:HK97 family phage major capsid protein
MCSLSLMQPTNGLHYTSNMENTTHARVRYSSRPVATNLPPSDLNVDGMGANDLRSLRATIDAAIQADNVPDAQMLNYLQLQERAAARLAAVEARDAYMQAQVQAAPAPSAPAVVRSLGDSHSGLASAFSISRAILAAAEGRQMQGAEAEVIAEGRRSNPHARGQVVLPSFIHTRNVYGNATGNGVDVATTGRQTLSAPMLTAHHGVPQLQQLGATVLDAQGSGTFLVPFLGRTAAASTGEASAVTSSASFNELSLTPTRYSRRTDVSALALRTNASAIDQVLLADFSAAHAWAQDAAGFAAIKANATFTAATETGTDDLAATTLGNILDLVSDIMAAIRVNEAPTLLCSTIAFEVVNSVVATNLSQTLAQAYFSSAGGRMVAAVGMVDGDIPAEKALASVAVGREIVGAGLVAGGYLPDLIIARWGDIDLVVDPFSEVDNAVIRVVSNSYASAGIVRDAFRCLAVASATIADSAV